MTINTIYCGDCREITRHWPPDSVDLVFGSPPYDDCRNNVLNLRGEAWVQWALDRYYEHLRLCRGVVAWVIEGDKPQTTDWSATPALLMADLKRSGVKLMKPSIYGRYGVPGRLTVLKNLYEWIVCATKTGKIPFTDPTACGPPPKCKPGGRTCARGRNGDRNVSGTDYKQPERTNLGNIIWCGAVGGGNMGDPLAFENEAPFPEFLAEVMIATYTKPGDLVLDPFCGSGTTLKIAKKLGRNYIGIDNRESECRLAQRRVDACCS